VPAETPATATIDAPPKAADAAQQARGPQMGVSLTDFTELRTEVTLLRRELGKLKEELQSLHVHEPAQAVAVAASVDVGSGPAENHPLDGAGQAKGALDTLKGSPVEDVA
jgi:hypothetical protein